MAETGSITILAVDDNDSLRYSLSRSLQGGGSNPGIVAGPVRLNSAETSLFVLRAANSVEPIIRAAHNR